MRTTSTTSTFLLLLLGLGLASFTGATPGNTTCAVLDGPAAFHFGQASSCGKPLATLPFDPILAIPVVEASRSIPADAYLQLGGTTTTTENTVRTARKTLKMRCTEWRHMSVDIYLTTRARLQQQALHLRNEADQQWEAAAAQVTKAFTDAQDTYTTAVTSFSDAVATFAARMPSVTSSAATFASSWLQAWGPSILRALLLALAMLTVLKVHVATDGAIVAWMDKTSRFLAPRVVAWLQWLLVWEVYVMLCVAEGVLDFIVGPSVLFLADCVVPVTSFILCTFATIAFPRYVKPNHEDEEKKEMGLEGVFLLRWMDELMQLPGIVLVLAFYSMCYLIVLAVSKVQTRSLAVVNGDVIEQEADH